MKRFWKEARADGRQVLLDGRPVRTPKRNLLEVPSAALAEAMASEWNGVGEELDPQALPLTGLANAAIDIVAADHQAFAENLARYGETDLLAYRATSPDELIARQAREWDPLLDWVRTRYDVHVDVVRGIMHQPQPEATVARLREATFARTDFELAALSPIVTIGGSLVVGLALLERAFEPEQLWSAVNLDELWQEELWGEDALALEAREARRRDWDAAVRFLYLL
ncbi:ATP12 family chaperone protein [Sphingomonas sp.]|jgi:chaperone required for assembly of F1-ATPase|uniref:ATP12 family chaperone protein n=1 Tax=Sphingomonas sp. TaxID=28214 RepID=UPI002DEA1E67|nr:ATP12 family protein [Sphingomonas sp.]HEV2568628.1 ATP12 family protein [Sphingomonas sp.]